MSKELLERILEELKKVDGTCSVAPGRMNVWVPGMRNGLMRGLIKELLARGWKIIPPS